jgi:UDP-N-acetylglucosamine diphosphorylase/glucosamine-1-phosphate N-acetyltransferase
MGGDRKSAKLKICLCCRQTIADIVSDRFAYSVNTPPDADQVLLINSRLLLTSKIKFHGGPAVQWHGEDPVVIQVDRGMLDRLAPGVLEDNVACQRLLAEVPEHEFIAKPRLIRYPWDLINANAEMLHYGWKQFGGRGELQGRVCDGVHILNEKAVHLGSDSTIKPGTVLDAEEGPIFIGERVTIGPNATLIGPCYVGDGCMIRPNATIGEGTTIGPRCKVGGEIEGSIFQGYANKQHEGFLGHSYVAEWVNLGAGTFNSDLKNTYGTVRVPVNGIEVDSGQMFVGLTIGDHSKTGIGQMFPTGAVVGFGCNVANGALAPKYVPSFTWLTNKGASPYDLDRCIAVAKRVMARRDVVMSKAEEARFRVLPERISLTEVCPLPA